MINTSLSPMVVDAFGGTEGLNRPGARYLVAGPRTVDHAVLTTLEAMRDEAYKAYDEEAQNAWRGIAPTNAAPAWDTVEAAYADYDPRNVGGLAHPRMSCVAVERGPGRIDSQSCRPLLIAYALCRTVLANNQPDSADRASMGL